ncbi:hypothetical protein LTR37_019594 [Vermiconidia calcicola]|uniref:Uncharacterized protein n=1 Tax=Vermiconidia calcicola TaxID=1690605 RepID=A0ACC3MDM3_9PEZI|nr:hypothetical protein LTR37_019594 [Vermiconidia calcicola]
MGSSFSKPTSIMPGVYPQEDEPQHQSPYTNDEAQATIRSVDQHDEPILCNIQAQLRARFPRYTDERINGMAVRMLELRSQSTYQARRSALSTAAAGTIEDEALTPQQQSCVDQMLQAHARIQATAAVGEQQQQQNATRTTTSTTTSTPTCPPQQYAHIKRQLQEQQMREEQSPTDGQAESHEDGS